MELLYNLQHDLAAITGMDHVTLQPAAGAHGEWTGLMMIRAYHESRGEHRTKVICPDSSHGTNPASATVAGFETITIKSNERGLVNLDELRAAVGSDTAALMLTNPNTLGLFEEQIVEIAEIVHDAGGLLYYDGANANAIMGITRPGDMGFDVVHLNLHKTMSTPHGGGGPGAGPVGVKEQADSFPADADRAKREDGSFYFDYNYPQSIGRVKGFYGNFGILVRAYTYIRTYGPEGLRKVSEYAVLNANYMCTGLRPISMFRIPASASMNSCFPETPEEARRPYTRHCQKAARLRLSSADHLLPAQRRRMHHDRADRNGKQTNARRLHRHDDRIAKEAEENPELVINAPYTTVVSRMDEALAARKPVLNCTCG